MSLFSDLHPDDVAVIREVYDSENAEEVFEMQLERALQAGCRTIVIEPNRLGDETGRWIMVGNCLHKTAVLSGIGSLTAGRKSFCEEEFSVLNYCPFQVFYGQTVPTSRYLLACRPSSAAVCTPYVGSSILVASTRWMPRDSWKWGTSSQARLFSFGKKTFHAFYFTLP